MLLYGVPWKLVWKSFFNFSTGGVAYCLVVENFVYSDLSIFEAGSIFVENEF
jgi:hypothetical protein